MGFLYSAEFTLIKQDNIIYHFRQIVSMNRPSDLNRTKRAESLSKTTAQKTRTGLGLGLGLGSLKGQITLQNLIEQIIKYLMEIIEALLQQENSNNYRSFMAANEAMHRQLQRKMQNNLAEKIYQLRCEFIDRLEEVQKLAKQTKSKPQDSYLKQERKLITQNILQRSASFNTLQHRNSHQRIASSQELPYVAESEEIASIEIQSIQSKLSALEETGKLKQTVEKLQKKFEDNCRDIKLLTQKHVEFKMNFEEKLQLSLQSLWNVISDNQAKVSEIQRSLNLI